MNGYSRRALLQRGLTSAGALVALGPLAGCGGEESSRRRPAGFGPLLKDRHGLLDLPRGFRYRVLSEQGARLADGAPVPGSADGMAAFRAPRGATVLVRNHELGDDDGPEVAGRNPYDRAARGGTTAIVVDPDRRKLDELVLSSGTRRNCAGGRTPWGTWLTCEEISGEGQVFEVTPGDPESRLSRTPIRGMGAFSHEAVGIDPRTGVVYLTEDDFGGSLPPSPAEEPADSGAFLYRYVPDDRRPRPGALHAGGSLEVLTVSEGVRTPNADLYSPRRRYGVVWKPVGAADPRADAETTEGSVRFNRLEGAYFAGGAFWFADTAGGEERLGQLFRYLPDGLALELFYESGEAGRMNAPDNIVVTPWGDLWVAEDGEDAGGESEGGVNRVVGVTPRGSVYPFARLPEGELAGPTFSPDGRTFFVNDYGAGRTFAVWGPFRGPSAAGRRTMALASPPPSFLTSPAYALADMGARHGLSPLEAAAYASLGLPLA
jgi:secreted PhoX family phosphatase